MSRYELSDYQWEQIEECIPRKKSKYERESRKPRKLMNAIIWVLRTENGVIEKIFLKLTLSSIQLKKSKSIVSVSKCINMGQILKKGYLQAGVDKSSAGLTTKIHTLVNESGKLIQFMTIFGNIYDSVIAKELLDCAIKPDIQAMLSGHMS